MPTNTKLEPTDHKAVIVAVAALILINAIVFFPAFDQKLGNYDEIRWIEAVDPPGAETLKAILTWDASRFRRMGYYAPLAAISMMGDLWVGKLTRNRDFPFKATNVALHILNTLLVFLLIRLYGFDLGIAFAVALIFAVHPLQVSSVAWVAERKNLLMGFFFLLALVCYQFYRRSERSSWYVATLFGYLLGLLAKPAAAALGPCMILADLCLVDRRFTLRSFLRAAPFIVVGLIWIKVATATEAAVLDAPPLFERLLMIPYKISFLLGKFLLPIHLTYIYPPLPLAASSAVLWIPAIVFVLVGALILIQHHARPIWALLWGMGFYILNFLPSSGVIPFAGMKELYVTDHYSYLSIIGVSLIVVLGVDHALDVRALRRRYAAKVAATAFTAIALGWLAAAQLTIWKNAETLWTYVLSANPMSYTAHYDYGHYLDEQGRYSEAARQYVLAAEINPDSFHAYNNLGIIMVKHGDTDKAIQFFKKAGEINPQFGDPHLALAKIYFFRGDYDSAMESCKKAAKLGADCQPDALRKEIDSRRQGVDK